MELVCLLIQKVISLLEDFSHAELALVKWAKFHFLGIVCKQHRPTFFNQAKNSLNYGTEMNFKETFALILELRSTGIELAEHFLITLKTSSNH